MICGRPIWRRFSDRADAFQKWSTASAESAKLRQRRWENSSKCRRSCSSDWNSIQATLIIEGGFWLLAIILYVRSTHPIIVGLGLLDELVSPRSRENERMSQNGKETSSCR